MIPRERVLTAFEHREPDAVPVDFSGHRSSGIAGIAYTRLRDQLGLPCRPVRIHDPIQQIAVVDPDVLDRFGVDTLELGRGFALDDTSWRDWRLPDGTSCQLAAWVRPVRADGEWRLVSPRGTVLARMPDGALYFEQVHYPFLESENLDDLAGAFEECMWTSSAAAAPPGPATPDELREGARRLRASTDRAIVGLFGGNLLECGQFLYRNDGFFLLLAGEPDRAERFLDRLVELHLETLGKYLAAVGEFIDVILFGDDLGMQTGPQISPAMYRRFFKERHRLLWRTAKQLAPAGRGSGALRCTAPLRVMLHSCGGIRELLPDLIDAGLEAVNPVQISCRGMETAALKRDFGRDIVLWGGGCDTRSVLGTASPAEVREHVRRQVEVLAPGGGFVFQQVHNVQAGVPPANVAAMFDAVRR
jgi:uroporphyrinogen decarboxylase